MDSEYIPAVETHLLRCEHIAQTFRIDVMQPARKRGETGAFPVIFATDGNLTFDVLKGISHGLQLFESVAPRFMLVGIGYPGASPWAGATLRTRDFTFPGFPRFPSGSLPWEGILEAEERSRDFAGGVDFQRFIADQLIPFIDRTYPTIRGHRTYFGHSAGGTFGLFTLFSRPGLFRNYIIVSPALMLGDDEFGLRAAREFVASTKSLENVALHLSVGSEEEFDSTRAQWQFTSAFYRLASLLKAASIPGLKLTTEAFPRETHMTVWPMAFMHGVRAVFAAHGTPFP